MGLTASLALRWTRRRRSGTPETATASVDSPQNPAPKAVLGAAVGTNNEHPGLQPPVGALPKL